LFCPTCGANNPVSAIACKACGAVMPGISEVFTMDSLSGNVPSQAEPRQQDHRAGVAVQESYGRGGQGPSLLGRVKLVVEQGKILGEQFLLSDYEMMVGRYDAGSGRCPDIDLTAQDPAYVHRQHVRISFSPAGESITVHDMGGRNGSYVNNKLIDRSGAARIRPGDKLRIGRVVMRLQLAPEVEGDKHS
jgi:hypothetical protein